jgi:predicted transcriptional regulator
MDADTRVRDVMVPIDQYPSVRDTDNLRAAIKAIMGAKIEVGPYKSLPRKVLVFDEIKVLVGFVRRRDILVGLEPEFLLHHPVSYRKMLFEVATDPNLWELQYDKVVEGIREQSLRPVSDVMRPIESIVDANDRIVRAAYEITSNNVAMVPVVDKGELVGVLRSVDAFHAIVDICDCT